MASAPKLKTTPATAEQMKTLSEAGMPTEALVGLDGLTLEQVTSLKEGVPPATFNDDTRENGWQHFDGAGVFIYDGLGDPLQTRSIAETTGDNAEKIIALEKRVDTLEKLGGVFGKLSDHEVTVLIRLLKRRAGE